MRKLKRSIKFFDAVGLGIGATVGVSVFSVMGPAAQLAGSGILIALAIAAVPMGLFAIVYSYLNSLWPRSGASFDWPTVFLHPFVGFFVAWMRILGSVGAIVVLALVMASYLERIIAVPRSVLMIGTIFIFCIVNIFGVGFSARLESVLTVGKIVAFVIYVLLGIRYINVAHFEPWLGFGWGGVFAALPLLVGLYMGIETTTELGEEIEDAQNIIGKAIAITTSITGFLYLAISGVALGVLGAAGLAGSDAPILDAGRPFLGQFTVPLVVFAAVTAISTSLNAMILVSSRSIFAMGRAGVLSRRLAQIHPKYQTPYVAVAAISAVSMAAVLIGSDLVFLFLAVNIPTIMKYLCNCMCAFIMPSRFPEYHAAARHKLSAGAIRMISGVGVALSVVIMLAGLSADWVAYVAMSGWALTGLLYWWFRGRHTGENSIVIESVTANSVST